MKNPRDPDLDEAVLRARLLSDLGQSEDADSVAAGIDAERLADLLIAEEEREPAPALVTATVDALRPEMARRAAVDLRRRVVRRVLLALLPLPIVVAYAGYVLQALYRPVALLLTPDLAGYLAGAHVLLLALLFGTTYAAIPMLLARSSPVRPTPAGWYPAGRAEGVFS